MLEDFPNATPVWLSDSWDTCKVFGIVTPAEFEIMCGFTGEKISSAWVRKEILFCSTARNGNACHSARAARGGEGGVFQNLFREVFQAVPPDLERAQSVAVGSSHTCALLEDGKVRCWGSNSSGQSTIPPDLDV